MTTRREQIKADYTRAVLAFRKDPTPRLATALKQLEGALRYEFRQNPMTVRIEHTDTFGGEPNYAWVHRHEVKVGWDSTRAVVRAAKKALGWTGHPCSVADFGDAIVLRPSGLCQIAFIDCYQGGQHENPPSHQRR